MNTKTIICFALLVVVQTISAAKLQSKTPYDLQSIAAKAVNRLSESYERSASHFNLYMEIIASNYNKSSISAEANAIKSIDDQTVAIIEHVDQLKKMAAAAFININACLAEFEPQLPNGVVFEPQVKVCAQEANAVAGIVIANGGNELEKVEDGVKALKKRLERCEVGANQCFVDVATDATAMWRTISTIVDGKLKDVQNGTQQMLNILDVCEGINLDQYAKKGDAVVEGLMECIDKL